MKPGGKPGPSHGEVTVLNITVILLLILFVFPSSSFACTSFALYGSQTFYGMNFDYFSIPLKFLIESRLEMTLFHLSFLFDQTVDDPEYKGYFAKTCGINSKGLFCSSQEIEPHIEGFKKAGNDEAHIDDQYETLSSHSTVDQVKKQIDGKQWIQCIGPSIHNMFADRYGNAIITETDNTKNFITGIEDDFIIMSNFANHSLKGRSYEQAVGSGADRYIKAFDYLRENLASFNVDKGFDLLKDVSLNDSQCLTLCSMIFEPEMNDIFIALHQNFEKIWKVSLDTKTIETYRGFETYHQTRLNHEGILSTDLQAFR